MIFVGADPGLSGAIAFIDGDRRLLGLHELPTIAMETAGAVKRRLHGHKLYGIVHRHVGEGKAIAMVEDVQAWSKKSPKVGAPEESSGPGASSMAAMVGTKYVLFAIFDLFGGRIVVKTVPPQTWKSHFGLKKPKIEGASRTEISTQFKAMSRARAVGLYPTADIRQSQHDGRAEAVLLAEYARVKEQAADDLFDELTRRR